MTKIAPGKGNEKKTTRTTVSPEELALAKAIFDLISRLNAYGRRTPRAGHRPRQQGVLQLT